MPLLRLVLSSSRRCFNGNLGSVLNWYMRLLSYFKSHTYDYLYWKTSRKMMYLPICSKMSIIIQYWQDRRDRRDILNCVQRLKLHVTFDRQVFLETRCLISQNSVKIRRLFCYFRWKRTSWRVWVNVCWTRSGCFSHYQGFLFGFQLKENPKTARCIYSQTHLEHHYFHFGLLLFCWKLPFHSWLSFFFFDFRKFHYFSWVCPQILGFFPGSPVVNPNLPPCTKLTI